MAGARVTALVVICVLLPVSWCQVPSINLVSVNESSGIITPTPVPESTTAIMTSTSTSEGPGPSSPVVSPTGTLSPPPTSSQTPTPTPVPHFSLKNKNDSVCVNVTGNIAFEFKYTNTTSKKDTTAKVTASDIENLHTVVNQSMSSCDDEQIMLYLTFYHNQSYLQYAAFEFTLVSNKGKKSTKYELKSVMADFDVRDTYLFPDFNTSTYGDHVNGSTDTSTKDDNDGLFQRSFNRSYYCRSVSTHNMSIMPYGAGKQLTLRLSRFQAQAFDFKNATSGHFDKSSHCPLDQKTSKIVPIAVGAALAGLVIVVLIAYLIGRFRSRKQQSYEALS